MGIAHTYYSRYGYTNSRLYYETGSTTEAYYSGSTGKRPECIGNASSSSTAFSRGHTGVIGYESSRFRFLEIPLIIGSKPCYKVNLEINMHKTASGGSYRLDSMYAMIRSSALSAVDSTTGPWSDGTQLTILKDGYYMTYKSGTSKSYTSSSDSVVMSCSIQYPFMANTTYYLYVYIRGATYGWHYIAGSYETRTTFMVTLEEGGLVRIYVDGAWKNAIPYIYDGGWKQAIPYIYDSGGWHMTG